jgi:uncharacterized membrane protein YphA (DoxX/SURF4 family)
MFAYLLRSHASMAAFVLRLGVAAIVVYHGCLKLSLAGGREWTDLLDETTQLAVAWAEVICGGALALGLLSRLAAIGIIVVQAGAIALAASPDFIPTDLTVHGFNFRRPGFEYNFSIIVMCAAIVLLGSRKIAVDHYILPRLGGSQPPSSA